MDLFELQVQTEQQQQAPLAFRMRPMTLDEIVGQDSVIGPGTALRKWIESSRLTSMILFGPPGTGKTTLAEVLAHHVKSRFEKLNAVGSGVADIRQVVERAQEHRSMYGTRTVLFIDEIHRFNKSQQDALLPHVESGLVTLIGATTENPYFEVNPALLSRSHVIRLEPLSEESLRILIRRALADAKRGLGDVHANVTEGAETVLVRLANGDARRALNALELAVTSSPLGPDGSVSVDEQQALSVVQRQHLRYDRAGDEHYDTISAFIKSVRGSDADAAMFWLAKMITAGEDPVFIARRLMILASEDVGNADSHALGLAVAAHQAARVIGMPEARIVLAQATEYLARAPKSNASYVALGNALKDVESGIALQVPTHLRGSGYRGAEALGSGIGYQYPHDFPGHWVEQNYWPDGLTPRRYFPSDDKAADE